MVHPHTIADVFELEPGDRHRFLASVWHGLYKIALEVDVDPDDPVYEYVREWLRDATPEQFGELLRIAYTHGFRDGMK